MKLSLLTLVLVACSVPPQGPPPCSAPPPPAPSPFHVIGEARRALWDSFELLKDDAAKQRYVGMDFVLRAHENWYIEQDPRYSALAACTVSLIDQVLPDMAIFGASHEAIANMNRAKTMFVSFGGSCDTKLPPSEVAPLSEGDLSGELDSSEAPQR